MNNILILVVMVIYFIVGAGAIKNGQYGTALTFIAYGVSNIGLYLLASGVCK